MPYYRNHQHFRRASQCIDTLHVCDGGSFIHQEYSISLLYFFISASVLRIYISESSAYNYSRLLIEKFNEFKYQSCGKVAKLQPVRW